MLLLASEERKRLASGHSSSLDEESALRAAESTLTEIPPDPIQPITRK
jgi:hypothetical protein